MNPKEDMSWSLTEYSKISQFYSYESKVLYILYSEALDRIVATDSRDLWTLLDAAKLLSSKLILNVFIVGFQDVDDSLGQRPLEWSITNKKLALPTKQTPEVVFLQNSTELTYAGPLISDIEKLKEDMNFIQFVIKATYAARLASVLNSSHNNNNNENQDFYLNLLDVNPDNIATSLDKSIWSNGFQNAIYKILYKSSHVKEALDLIKKTLTIVPTNQLSRSPSPIQSSIADTFHKNYKKTFSDLLEWNFDE